MSYVTTRPYTSVAAVTPHDSTNITPPNPRALYVGGTGNAVVVMKDGTSATFTGIPAGTLLEVEALRVNATSTTATAIVALY
jgi:hypothetical protein